MVEPLTDTPADEVVARLILTPDPAFVKSLGTHHTLESAMADLVDNSIDAHATTVTIRFVTRGGHLAGIIVVDDGDGMDADLADRAMRLGGQRDYAPGDLGHFGVGLKAAALGVANVLTVWSRRYGASAVGRRLSRVDMQRDYSCDVLSTQAAERSIEHALDGRAHGTVIALTELKHGVHGASPAEAAAWLTNAQQRVRHHLGLVYHRLLAANRVVVQTIQVDEHGNQGVATPVRPVDPFAYPLTGRPGFPKQLQAKASGVEVTVTCHIWPAKYENNTEFRLQQKSAEETQGFYVYRADRLLQVGGWNNVANASSLRKLARVSIDADGLDGLVQLNPEKSGTQFSTALAHALAQATSGVGNDAVSFEDYLNAAEDVLVQSKKRTHKRKPVVQPDRGFAEGVRRAIGEELDFHADEDPVEVRWKRLPTGTFFEIDRPLRTLWLNLLYRDLFSPGQKGLNDAPLVKALMFLLAQDHFAGTQYSSAKRDEAAVWQAVLGAAAEEEKARRNRGGGTR
ncbi:histidine kinase [Actinotalea ferrariae CF5-4]|uniref:Histidine kinase n=1 Tax=Actinotalea ferrariae CF5-4 TaxID=948458 RepID=A0A021VPD4_9CELL|nr:ATP-binding protein [Actinotalea ferrariae]EYR63016.1 histidine kinase [Actinotalea ferrariae CF5-4]